MKKKVIITVSVLAVIAVAGLFFRSYLNKNKEPVYYWRPAYVEKGSVSVIVTATGSIAADTTVSVGTQVTGILKKEYVDFNSPVKKGQIIALIDTSTLYPTMLDARAALEKAKAQCDEYKRELDRSKIMLDEKVVAQADYDLALANFQTASATVKSMDAQYQRALINLRYAVIRAPINGVIVSRTYDEGITVIASFNTPTLFVIANDLKKMQVQADVDEADIGQVKEGQNVDFTVDAYPDDVFHGVIKQVRLQPVLVQNVINYVVIVEAPNPELKLIPGLTANINIKVIEHNNVLKVPSNAISFVPPATYLDADTQIPDSVKSKLQVRTQQTVLKIIPGGEDIYVWKENRTKIFPVLVKKGISDGIYTEVSGNIKEGDTVVTGVNSSAASVQATSQPSSPQNPFMPKFNTKKK
jgi:HlyD family secretion protein